VGNVAASRIGVSGVLRLAVSGVLACAFGLAGGASTGAASPAGSGSFRLLFGSDWSGTSEIYAADPSGARPTAQLTFGRAPACGQTGCGYADLGPSPDGRFILYTDFSGCGVSSSRSALFVARADGSHVLVLARSASTAGCPQGIGAVWAPDSRRVAYAVAGRIEIADVDGRHRRVVGRGDRVSWSPDGTSIAFSAVGVSGTGPLSVWTNGRTRVLAATATDFRWSPDGRWIAYGLTNASYQHEAVIVRPDGSGRRVVAGAVLQPSGWSPDVAFSPSGRAAVSRPSGSPTAPCVRSVSLPRSRGSRAATCWR
jgi:Tol biopolymer transport system component